MTTTGPEELTPAAPASPLEDIRKKLLAEQRDATKDALVRDYVDVRIEKLTRPGAYSVWARYRYPDLTHINRLQAQLGKHSKGGPHAVRSVYIHFLVQQCLGVFMVPDDDPDLQLGLSLRVPPEEAEDPANWPDFKTGWQDLAKAFLMDLDKITHVGKFLTEIYGDGYIVSTTDKLLHEAGYDQGN